MAIKRLENIGIDGEYSYPSIPPQSWPLVKIHMPCQEVLNMNEEIIVVGENKDGPGYYAMMANERTVFVGTSKIEAIENLLTKGESKK